MIILYFDDRYFLWAPPLIESIAINEPSERIAVFGFDLSPSQRKEILSFGNVRHLVEIKGGPFNVLKKKPWELLRIKGYKTSKDEVANLMIGKKAWYLRESFKAFPKEDMYMMLDVDMLLLKPLTNFKRRMKNYDMAGAFRRKLIMESGRSVERTEKDKISGGFLAFKPTKAVMLLIKEWDRFLSSGPYYWNKDQPSLTKLYQKHEKSIRFLDVSRKVYLNPSLDEGAVVWSAHKSKHGTKEERYKAYLAKLQRIRNGK